MKFNEARSIMSALGRGDLLAGMELFRDMMDEAMLADRHSHGEESYEEWAENWHYEVDAYNVIFDGMSKLFA